MPEPTPPSPSGQPPAHAPDTPPTPDASPPVPAASLADTTGTGTIIALGCIGATLFLIVLGLIYIVIVQVLG